ncbi:MAG: transposase [Solirubrobacterales bacterium]|nr:transposase [Solirubrobacterales bacterium]
MRTPRDRDGSFEPQLVKKRQTRLAGLDDRVLNMYAGGMSVRDIAAHLQGLYGVEIGRDTISRVTDAVLEDVAAWRSRPLERECSPRTMACAPGCAATRGRRPSSGAP